MKTYKVVSVSYKANSQYQGWAGNDSWDLQLEDEAGRRFESEAFMCVGNPPERVELHDAVVHPTVVI